MQVEGPGVSGGRRWAARNTAGGEPRSPHARACAASPASPSASPAEVTAAARGSSPYLQPTGRGRAFWLSFQARGGVALRGAAGGSGGSEPGPARAAGHALRRSAAGSSRCTHPPMGGSAGSGTAVCLGHVHKGRWRREGSWTRRRRLRVASARRSAGGATRYLLPTSPPPSAHRPPPAPAGTLRVGGGVQRAVDTRARPPSVGGVRAPAPAAQETSGLLLADLRAAPTALPAAAASETANRSPRLLPASPRRRP